MISGHFAANLTTVKFWVAVPIQILAVWIQIWTFKNSTFSVSIRNLLQNFKITRRKFQVNRTFDHYTLNFCRCSNSCKFTRWASDRSEFDISRINLHTKSTFLSFCTICVLIKFSRRQVYSKFEVLESYTRSQFHFSALRQRHETSKHCWLFWDQFWFSEIFGIVSKPFESLTSFPYTFAIECVRLAIFWFHGKSGKFGSKNTFGKYRLNFYPP